MVWLQSKPGGVPLNFFMLIFKVSILFACNLIWCAILGFQDGVKQQKIRRNKGKKTKKLRLEKPKIQQKTATILWRFLVAIFHYKLVIFLRCLPFWGPPIKVTAFFFTICRFPRKIMVKARTEFGKILLTS